MTQQAKQTDTINGRKYRFTLDKTRHMPHSQVQAEYFNERRQEWREVKNWNTREVLLNRAISASSKKTIERSVAIKSVMIADAHSNAGAN